MAARRRQKIATEKSNFEKLTGYNPDNFNRPQYTQPHTEVPAEGNETATQKKLRRRML